MCFRAHSGARERYRSVVARARPAGASALGPRRPATDPQAQPRQVKSLVLAAGSRDGIDAEAVDRSGLCTQLQLGTTACAIRRKGSWMSNISTKVCLLDCSCHPQSPQPAVPSDQSAQQVSRRKTCACFARPASSPRPPPSREGAGGLWSCRACCMARQHAMPQLRLGGPTMLRAQFPSALRATQRACVVP